MGMRINHGALEVRNGFTHYPQVREEWRFFPGDWRVPSRIVVIDGDGGLTFDVLTWLLEQDVPLIRLDWRGRVQVIAGNNGYVAERRLVEAQRRAQADPKQAMAINRWLVAEKIAGAKKTLTEAVEPTEAKQRALVELDASEREIRTRPPRTIGDLRGIEGRVALAYFRAWRSVPLRWKGAARRPIPDDWRHIGSRSSPISRRSEANRQATHPTNAMLNYGYAVLESQVQMATVAAGFDPTIGLMHAEHPDRQALVLDLMEPLRPVIDATVLGLARREIFASADFTIGKDGVCRLHPALARRVVAEIGPLDGLRSTLAGFLDRIGHKPPPSIQRRSGAWVAQRRLVVAH